MLYTTIQAALRSVIKDEKGAAMAEYAILVALIAIVAAVAVGTLGSGISSKFASLATSL